VTVLAASVAVKLPPLTVIAVPEVRLALDDVVHGVTEVGAVPPEIVIGRLTDPVLLLMTTMAMALPVPL